MMFPASLLIMTGKNVAGDLLGITHANFLLQNLKIQCKCPNKIKLTKANQTKPI